MERYESQQQHGADQRIFSIVHKYMHIYLWTHPSGDYHDELTHTRFRYELVLMIIILLDFSFLTRNSSKIPVLRQNCPLLTPCRETRRLASELFFRHTAYTLHIRKARTRFTYKLFLSYHRMARVVNWLTAKWQVNLRGSVCEFCAFVPVRSASLTAFA